jgi:hypothetical protein
MHWSATQGRSVEQQRLRRAASTVLPFVSLSTVQGNSHSSSTVTPSQITLGFGCDNADSGELGGSATFSGPRLITDLFLFIEAASAPVPKPIHC